MPHRATGETIALRRAGAFWVIALPNGTIQRAASPEHGLDIVYRYVHSVEVAEQAPAISLHAATLRLAGRRIVLAGNRASGKTTLAMTLLFDGFGLEADEAIYLTPTGAIPRPRSVRIKQAALRMLPQLRPYLDRLPHYRDWLERKIFAFDPREAGLPWRIERGPVDHLVLIEPNHGGHSVLSPLAASQAVVETLAHATLPEGGRGRSLAAIADLVGGARTHRLALGDLPNAIRHLRRICHDAT